MEATVIDNELDVSTIRRGDIKSTLSLSTMGPTPWVGIPSNESMEDSRWKETSDLLDSSQMDGRT